MHIALEILGGIVLIWVFHMTLFSSIKRPKNLMTGRRFRAVPSLNSPGKFVGIKHF